MSPSELKFTFTLTADDLAKARKESMSHVRPFVVVTVIYFLIGMQLVSSSNRVVIFVKERGEVTLGRVGRGREDGRTCDQQEPNPSLPLNRRRRAEHEDLPAGEQHERAH